MTGRTNGTSNRPGTGPNTPAQAGRRIAFFGGSFDPPHLGHLAIARAARDAFHLDTVLFAPVGVQPLKPEGPSASFEDRLAMTRLAIENEPGFAISLVDAPKSPLAGSTQPNFTIDTLESLRAEFEPDCTLYCLMGADSFFGLRQWHRAAEVPFAAALIVASRPGQPLDRLQAALPPGLTLEPAPKNTSDQNAPHIDQINSGAHASSSNKSGPCEYRLNESCTNESPIDVRASLIVNPAGERAPFYELPGLDVEISASQIREAIRGVVPSVRGTSAPDIDALSIEGPSVAPAGSAPPASAPIETMLPSSVAEYIRAHGLYR
jgi:nicotinate-nucleotide adenylyltransferase